MNKSRIVASTIGVIGILALGLLLYLRGMDTGQKNQGLVFIPISATLSEVEGEVLIKQAGLGEYLVARDGSVVNTDGVITTSHNGRAKLNFPDGSWIRLSPNTLITLRHSVQNPEETATRVSLYLGKIWIILKGGALSVDMGSGVASVRGSFMSVQSIQEEEIAGIADKYTGLSDLIIKAHEDSKNAICNMGRCEEDEPQNSPSDEHEAESRISILGDFNKQQEEMYQSIVCAAKDGGCAEVECLEGECNIENEAGEEDLTAGQKLILLGLTNPPLVGEMDQSDYDDWELQEPEAETILPTVMAIIEERNQRPTNAVQDADGDGVPDERDACIRLGDLGWGLSEDGCPIYPEGDADGDSVPNNDDRCPRYGDRGFGVDENGCPIGPPDTDRDGYPDRDDKCPTQGDLGFGVDSLGCPIHQPDGDFDQDGIPNGIDSCPRLGDYGYGIDEDGCPLNPPDSDGDGYPDDVDACPDQGTSSGGVDERGCIYEGDYGQYTVVPCSGFAALEQYVFHLEANFENGRNSDGDNALVSWDDCEPDSNPSACPPDLPLSCPTGECVADIGDCPASKDDSTCTEAEIRACNLRVPVCTLNEIPQLVSGSCCPTCQEDSSYTDRDSDGVVDDDDRCPDEGDQGLGIKADGCPQEDQDGDGILDDDDACPLEGDQDYGLDSRGCPNPPTDRDGDGVFDNDDACPEEGDQGYGLDSRGCPNPPTDRDGDAVFDNDDACPTQGDQGYGVNSRGCPNPPPVRDSDGDGVNDNEDACPKQGDEGYGVNRKGCPNSPPDRDGDGVPDDDDQCPDRPGPRTNRGCP